jgi:uncharacterized membrane protein
MPVTRISRPAAGENLISKSSMASDRGKCYPSNQRMVYLKSFLAGILALVSALLLCIAGLIGWALWMSHTSSNEGSVGAVGYDITSPWIGIPLLTVTALIFLAGFSWEFRRVRRSQRSR